VAGFRIGNPTAVEWHLLQQAEWVWLTIIYLIASKINKQ
jgi:hypothetical protein